MTPKLISDLKKSNRKLIREIKELKSHGLSTQIEISKFKSESASIHKISTELLRELGEFRKTVDFSHNETFWRRVSAAIMGKRKFQIEREHQRFKLESSGLFDPEFYLEQNSDVANSEVDPLDHFIDWGNYELRNPNRHFDLRWYLVSNPDVRVSKQNPVLHYAEYGWREGRKPHPEFDPVWYLKSYADVAKAGAEPLSHFIRHGQFEGRLRNQEDFAQLDLEKTLSKRELIVQKQNIKPNGKLRGSKIAIGVVIFNNDVDELRRCFGSASIALKTLPFKSQHIKLTIDNGKPSDSRLIKSHGFKQLQSKGNVGFGTAHNILMKESFKAGADYYVVTNPDGAFHPDSIMALVEMAQAAKDQAIVEALQFPEEHPKTYDPQTFETGWASGACMLIPRCVYETIGGFDDRFFMYCEDVDLSWRARKAGFKVKTCPRAMYFHPVIERPFDPIVHGRFLTSGIVLARKWGGKEFERGLLGEAKKWKLDIRKIITPPIEADASVATFKHQFTFAQARW